MTVLLACQPTYLSTSIDPHNVLQEQDRIEAAGEQSDPSVLRSWKAIRQRGTRGGLENIRRSEQDRWKGKKHRDCSIHIESIHRENTKRS